MNKTLKSVLTNDDAMAFRKFLQEGLAEMDRHFELMARDQVEIDRLAASSQANLQEIRAISEQTEAILATLK